MNHEQVMRQALDALLRVQPQIRGAIPQQDVEDAIDNLRKAVAEPQIDPVDEYRKGFIAGQIDMRDRERAEPMQEPVGYLPAYELIRLQSGHDGRLRSAKFGASALDEDVAVYTTAPQRKPLTDEEIADMWVGILYDTPPSGVHDDGLVPHRLARAIERAHGIGV